MTLPKAPQASLRFRWELNWKVCLFSVVFLPVFCTLGFWQLSRAEQKHTLAQTLEAEQAKPPIPFTLYQRDAELQGISYRPVELTGAFAPDQYWLLENKTHQGRIGYEVIMPFLTLSGQWVVINRGWIPSTGYRDLLPSVDTPIGEQTLWGWMVNPSQNRFLAGATVAKTGWPKLMLEPDFEIFEQGLGQSVWPQLLQIAPESPGAFTTHWQPITMPAEKHRGYAVQWFSMAFFLLVLTLVANSNIVQWIQHRND